MWVITELANALALIRSKYESGSNDTDTKDLHSEVMTENTVNVEFGSEELV
jgi:hypothetical protein